MRAAGGRRRRGIDRLSLSLAAVDVVATGGSDRDDCGAVIVVDVGRSLTTGDSEKR